MKIVHVLNACVPGGIENFLKNLLPELKKQGLDVELWILVSFSDFFNEDSELLRYEKQYCEFLISEGISVKFVGKRVRKDRTQTIKKLRYLFSQSRPDLVHSHHSHITFYLLSSIYNIVPVIETIHSINPSYYWLEKIFLRFFVNRYIAVSEAVKDRMVKRFRIPEEKISVIYNGIDLNKFKFEREISRTVRSIVSIGRLAPEKDYPNLFKAYKYLLNRIDNNTFQIPRLRIVGSGELENELKNLVAQLGIEEFVDFLGVRTDIEKVLLESDIFVLSSQWEGLSIALIEAIASGIPVVATNVGGNHEIIENGVNGLLVPPGDPLALAEAILKLLIDKNLREYFSVKGREKSHLFSIQRCAQEYIQIYGKSLLRVK